MQRLVLDAALTHPRSWSYNLPSKVYRALPTRLRLGRDIRQPKEPAYRASISVIGMIVLGFVSSAVSHVRQESDAGLSYP